MDSFEFNKIAAGILLSLLIAMTGSLLSEHLVHRDHLEKNVIEIAVEVGSAGAAEASKELEPITPLLASASVERGEIVAKKCVQCHTFTSGGADSTGPNLFGIVGAKFGHKEGYPYSAAFKGKQGNWDVEELNKYLHKPREYAPGTKMTFIGLKDDKERADLIAYLQTLKA